MAAILVVVLTTLTGLGGAARREPAIAWVVAIVVNGGVLCLLVSHFR